MTEVGDRVRVYPQSLTLRILWGWAGTIEVIHTGILAGGLIVRLDHDGETLGIGEDSVGAEDAQVWREPLQGRIPHYAITLAKSTTAERDGK